MEKVVYFLGAGFSAPLGLPIMNNFLEKSKDIVMSGDKPLEDKYEYFFEIFNSIKNMHYIKSFYESDLFNIEEILSILEMNEMLDASFKSQFHSYIIDVIEYYTPQIDDIKDRKYELKRDMYADPSLNAYAFFIANLFKLKFHEKELISNISGERKRVPYLDFNSKINTSYGIVTLNYDLILEKFCSAINKLFNRDEIVGEIGFNKDLNDGKIKVPYAKLHGSIEKKQIIPPSWNKILDKNQNKELINNWEIAYNLLREATQIRIIGYSLPETDSYVKYLFKSAILKSENLKKIDVICYDPDNSVKSRYDDFILFKNYRFVSKTSQNYLGNLISKDDTISSVDGIKTLFYDRLETAHEYFMSNIIVK